MATNRRTIQTEDFVVFRGNEETLTFTFTESSSAYDLTGKDLVFRAFRSGAVLLRKESGDADFVVATPSNGIAAITLSDTETRSIPLGKSVPYEIENVTDKITLVQGSLTGTGGINDDV